MRFQTLVAKALAAPTEAEALTGSTNLAPGQTDTTDKICILKKCINVSNPGPKCNIDRKQIKPSLLLTLKSSQTG